MGVGISPSPLGSKRLILVLRGSSETRFSYARRIRRAKIPNLPPTLHYQHNRTGVLIWKALGSALKISPETLQEDFEQVFDYVENRLTIAYFPEPGAALAR